MSKRRILGALSLLLMVPCIAGAQAVQAPVSATAPMTLEQAVQRGKTQRLSVRIAEAEVEAARARMGQARALRWPSVDLTANTSNTNNYDSFSGINASVMLPGLNTPSTIAVTQSVPRYQASGGVQLNYPVYAGGRIEAQIERQEQALLAAEVKQRMAVRDVALEIAQAYFKLRSACIRRDAAQRRTERATEDLQRAQQRLRDGRIAAIDVSEAELALTENQVALRARGEELDIAQADFTASQSEGPSKTDPTAPSCGFTSEIAADLAWINALAGTSLEAEDNQLQVRAAEKTVQIERAALKPQLNVTAQYTGIGRSANTYSGALDDFGRQRAAVGVDFSIKLFDGGLTRDRVAEAQAEVKRLSLVAQRDAGQRMQARKQDALRVRMAQGRVELARARLELAQKQSAIARERQSSGSGSAVAVDEQTERMQNAQDEYRLAELDLALARIAALLPSSRIQPGAPEAPNLNDSKEKLNHE